MVATDIVEIALGSDLPVGLSRITWDYWQLGKADSGRVNKHLYSHFILISNCFSKSSISASTHSWLNSGFCTRTLQMTKNAERGLKYTRATADIGFLYCGGGKLSHLRCMSHILQ